MGRVAEIEGRRYGFADLALRPALRSALLLTEDPPPGGDPSPGPSRTAWQERSTECDPSLFSRLKRWSIGCSASGASETAEA